MIALLVAAAVLAAVIVAVTLMRAPPLTDSELRSIGLRPEPDPPVGEPLGDPTMQYWTTGPEGQVIGWISVADIRNLTRAHDLGAVIDPRTRRCELVRE